MGELAKKRTLTVHEAALVLGVSSHTVYEAVARKELPSIRLGRRILVPKDALEQMLAQVGSRRG